MWWWIELEIYFWHHSNFSSGEINFVNLLKLVFVEHFLPLEIPKKTYS